MASRRDLRKALSLASWRVMLKAVKKRLLAGVWLVIFFSLLLGMICGKNGAIDLFRLKSESNRLVRIVDDLKRENQTLYRTIQRLKSDLQYIGEVARDELGMVAEDELIYQFEPGKKEK